MSIGLNILAQTVHDRARLYDWLARAKPGLCVVCDEPDVAMRVKMAAPGALVAHRWIYDEDASVDALTPRAWAARFLPGLPAGVAGYALNEPSGDWRAISRWCADVMSIAAARNQPLIVGNLAVGNPPQAAIDAGDFDALLLAFNEFPLHRFGLHEYAQVDPAREPYRVGRYRALKARAARIGARVRFVMTEAGRDVGGGPDDGWRAVMDASAYAAFLKAQAAVYADDGIPMAVFCYGTGGRGLWLTFDIQDAPDVLNAIADYNAGKGDDAMAGPPGWVQVKTGPRGVNVRSGAGLNYAPIAAVKTGDWVRPEGPTTSASGYTWRKVVLSDCRSGYVAMEVISL
jgi:hypothetical protein